MTQESLRNLKRHSERFVRQRGGLAAVEFALILPFMLLLFLGSFEVTQAVSVQRLVTLTASTVANITTQYATISKSSTMPDILNASTMVLIPYSSANANVVVSVVQVDANKNATVAWSQASNGAARVQGAAVTLPAALDIANTEVVWGETTYAYTPVVDFLHMGTLNLYSSIFMLPRSSSGQILQIP